jgi:hypothetical protein
MRHSLSVTVLACLLAVGAQAQSTNLTFTPGKLVILRGGDGVLTIGTARQHPIFLDEYDPSLTNQVAPIISIELPTNSGSGSLWMNAHAGSEGQGLTRSADRQYLTLCGYSGNINTISGTPSSATNASYPNGYPRGFGLMDAFGNFSVPYASTEWYGLQPGITQNNPRGVATDGSGNYWGCGTIAGTQSGGFSETGGMYWNGAVTGSDPEPFEYSVDSAYYMKIVSGVLYMVALSEVGGAQYNGIYNFVNLPINGGGLVPLPEVSTNQGGSFCATNLFINAGTTYANLKSFDMNPAGTVAYVADTTYGIIKFVNVGGGSWTSPYIFNSNNIGDIPALNKAKATGCFGVAVDFSGTNPVIYATTMDEGDGANTCSNRLISFIDTGSAPNPAVSICKTLAVASNINEVFRGIAFAPDLTPAITNQPVGTSLLVNQSETLSVGVQSTTAVTYQWTYDGTNLTDAGAISGSSTSALTINPTAVANSGSYSVIVSNQYGMVTSQVATLVITTQPVPPSIPGYAVQYITNYIGNNQAFSVNPSGTPPFSYQWYYGTTALVDDGVTYSGSTNATLYITNLQTSNAGSYYVTISNAAPTGFSNLFAVLTVNYTAPGIGAGGQPVSLVNLVGQTANFNVSASGTSPLHYQWDQVMLVSTNRVTNVLANANEFSGVNTQTLTITGVTTADTASYFCIVTNGGGSVTSSIVTDTVLVPPALSYVGYSNQIYSQSFDSLPNPGTNVVNTIGGGGPVAIGGVTYEVADPFDFAYPLYNNVTLGASGGLGLSNTMPGWYGYTDGNTASSGSQLGASDGSTTTGGIYSFGLTNSLSVSSNRALGLIATSTSGGSHFGLKLINTSTNSLYYVSMQFTGEFWKTGTKPKTMVFTYNIDPAGNGSTLSQAEVLASSNNPVAALNVSFPTAGIVGGTNGTLPANQTNCAVTNLALANAWTPGSALWLIWSIDDPTGSGQGYGIDNFSFYASSSASLTPAQDFNITGVSYSSATGVSFGFNSAPFSATALSVRATTNLTVPLAQWTDLGNPTESSFGKYQFQDSQATTNSQRFYIVTSP